MATMYSAAVNSIGKLNTVPISTLSNYKLQSHCRRLTCRSSNTAPNSVISAPARNSPQLHGHAQDSLSLKDIYQNTAPAKKALEENYIENDPRHSHGSNIEEIEDILRGKLVRGGFVYQQKLLIKSYELGPDGKATMGSILNHLQESSINHLKSCGLVAEGFGSTPEMTRRNLIWVVYKLQVEVDCYPSWGDVVEVSTWACACGNKGKRRDWILRDYNTGQVLIRAVSLYVMMNKETRRLSKFIDEIRAETNPHFLDCDPIIKEDNTKIPKLDVASADYIRTGLLSGWSDLDINQHVNHVKYINWIVESAPLSVLQNQWLSALTLEYRKECRTDSALQSSSSVVQNQNQDVNQSLERQIELHHSLCLENGSELVRGKTVWRPRPRKL